MESDIIALVGIVIVPWTGTDQKTRLNERSRKLIMTNTTLAQTGLGRMLAAQQLELLLPDQFEALPEPDRTKYLGQFTEVVYRHRNSFKRSGELGLKFFDTLLEHLEINEKTYGDLVGIYLTNVKLDRLATAPLPDEVEHQWIND